MSASLPTFLAESKRNSSQSTSQLSEEHDDARLLSVSTTQRTSSRSADLPSASTTSAHSSASRKPKLRNRFYFWTGLGICVLWFLLVEYSIIRSANTEEATDTEVATVPPLWTPPAVPKLPSVAKQTPTLPTTTAPSKKPSRPSRKHHTLVSTTGTPSASQTVNASTHPTSTAVGRSNDTSHVNATHVSAGTHTSTSQAPRRRRQSRQRAPRGNLNLPFVVLVQHADAEERLSKAMPLPPVPIANCTTGNASACSTTHTVIMDNSTTALNVSRAATGGDQRLSRDLLPSWTLQTVDGACADCVDGYAHGAAVQGVRLRGRHGVFALPRSPRGLLGPMLLGMLSVTDDVDAAAELPRWSWLRHAYADFPAAGRRGGGAAARPLLAVMGIPSTDHPARRALRDAQRATWMSYHEVARSENGFDGALLPLFLFAAAEAYRPATAAAQAALATTAALCPLCHNVSLLLPTRGEFVAGSRAALAAEEKKEAAAAAGAGRVGVTAGVAVRRVVLRRDWRTAGVGDSPCADVATRAVAPLSVSAVPPPLRAALSLPVTPAFVAPADYICCASAALWREALDYRNAVWLDMMTDRRATTRKKLGDAGGWGLPAEVGMTQKQVLWLIYAYHNFREVPYIIKGDDDAYVKVPQYLSDLRYVRSGRQPRVEFAVTDNASITQAIIQSDLSYNVNNTECLYAGSMRGYKHCNFAAGMLILIHRNLIRVLLEQRYAPGDVNVIRLAMDDYTDDYKNAYRRKMFHHEDIMLGLWLYDVSPRAKETCLHHKVRYVRDGWSGMHDMHRGKLHNVTWSTVVAHRSTPADAYFLHYYYQQEFLMSAVELPTTMTSREAMARKLAAQWVREQNATFSKNESLRQVTGWQRMPDVVWTHNLTTSPRFVVPVEDRVAIYDVVYRRWVHAASRVFDGYGARY